MARRGQYAPLHRRIPLVVLRKPASGEVTLLHCHVFTGPHNGILSAVGNKIPPYHHLRLGSMKYHTSPHPTRAIFSFADGQGFWVST